MWGYAHILLFLFPDVFQRERPRLGPGRLHLRGRAHPAGGVGGRPEDGSGSVKGGTGIKEGRLRIPDQSRFRLYAACSTCAFFCAIWRKNGATQSFLRCSKICLNGGYSAAFPMFCGAVTCEKVVIGCARSVFVCPA